MLSDPQTAVPETDAFNPGDRASIEGIEVEIVSVRESVASVRMPDGNLRAVETKDLKPLDQPTQLWADDWTYSTPISVLWRGYNDEPIEAVAIACNHRLITLLLPDTEAKTPIERILKWNWEGKRGDSVKILAVDTDHPPSLVGKTGTVLSTMKATAEVKVKSNAYAIPFRFLDLLNSSSEQTIVATPVESLQPILTRVEIEISTIRTDGGTQIRANGLDEQTVEHYTALWQEMGDECPLSPVKVMRDNERNHWLFDGFHTREAAVRASRSTVFADIYEGSLQDAIWTSCFVQIDRGLSLSTVDRRKAITQAVVLNSRRTPPMSYRALARRLGVDPGTIGYHYDKLVQKGEVPASREVSAERDGKTYILKPSSKPKHTFEEVAELYSPIGKLLKTIDPRRPFELERPGLSKFFVSLKDAVNQLEGLSGAFRDARKESLPPLNREETDPSEEISSDSPGRCSALPEEPDAAPEEPEIVQSPQPQPRSRVANDYYPTPEPVTTLLMEEVEISGQVFDCCAGDGAIAGLFNGSISNDINTQFDCDFYLDATDPESWQAFEAEGGCDWVVTNPPYQGDMPIEILKQSFEHARIGCAFLLRLSMLEPCRNRGDWLRENTDHLERVIFVNPRPSFRSDVNGGDQVTVCWVVFRKNWSWQAIGQRCPFVFKNWK